MALFGAQLTRWNVAVRGMQRKITRKEPRPIIVHMHVMKSAGQTINAHLKRCFGSYNRSAAGCLIRENWSDLQTTPDDLSVARRAQYVTGHLSWSSMTEICDGRNAYVFTFLRNPADRVRSLYNYARITSTDKRRSQVAELYARVRMMSPAEFLTSTDPEIAYLIDDVLVRQFSGSFDQGPANAEMLERAHHNLLSLDYIGTTGSLDDDVRQIMLANDLPVPRNLRSANVTRTKMNASGIAADLIDDWDDQCLDLLSRRIRWDTLLYDTLTEQR